MKTRLSVPKTPADNRIRLWRIGFNCISMHRKAPALNHPDIPQWLAQYARNRRYESACLPGFPRSWCEAVSMDVVRELKALGVEYIGIRAGKVQLDKPFQPLRPTHPEYLEGEEEDAGALEMVHKWVEFDLGGRRWTLDLTGDQFNPYMEQPLPGVLIVPCENRPTSYVDVGLWDWSAYQPTEGDLERAEECVDLSTVIVA